MELMVELGMEIDNKDDDFITTKILTTIENKNNQRTEMGENKNNSISYYRITIVYLGYYYKLHTLYPSKNIAKNHQKRPI